MALTNDYESFVKEKYQKVDKFQTIEKDSPEFHKHFHTWGFYEYNDTLVKIDGVTRDDISLTPGKLFLYEKFISNYSKTRQIFYPKIGIYLNMLPCDQTVEVEWSDYRRTWEYHKKYEWIDKTTGEVKKSDFTYLSTQVNSLPIWDDDLLIYGVWDKLPNWKELKKHYERTWWFHKTIQDKRDIMLNNLING